MSTIYHQETTNARHRHRGTYADISGCFELPVGPFPDRAAAAQWIEQNKERLVTLYGEEAGAVASAQPQDKGENDVR